MCWSAVAFGCLSEEPTDFDHDDSARGSFSIDVLTSDVIATVATVSWTMSEDEVEQAFIEYSIDDGAPAYAFVVPDGDEFSCTLMGLKPDSWYTVRAIVETTGSSILSDREAFETGSPPTTLPEFTLDVEDEAEGHRGFLVTTIQSEDSAVVIIDEEGDLVWWYPQEGHISFRAALSHDRKSVLFARGANAATHPEWHGMVLVRAELDGSAERLMWIPDMHHDFVELPDGVVAYLGVDARDVEGVSVPVEIDTIVEMTADGNGRRVVWSAWDHFTFDPEDLFDNGNGQSFGWPHANAIDYHPASDTYAVSLYQLGVIVLIDRKTGEVVWQIGRQDSDFALSSPLEVGQFGPQHQFDLAGDSLLVFNNGEPEDFKSNAVEYELDFDQWTAETRAVYSASPPIFCPVAGDASYLRNGNWLVTWSTAGLIEEVTDQGEVVGRLGLPLGTAFGYTNYVDDLYPLVEVTEFDER